MNDPNPPKPKRRWFQFSVRTLIAVTLVSCVAFGGWLQIRRDRARENRESMAAVEKAVDEIRKLGGDVGSSYVYSKAGSWSRLGFTGARKVTWRPATWLEEVFDDPGGPNDPIGGFSVSFVEFKRTNVTDTGLEHLKVLTSLKYLHLENTQIGNIGLANVKGLTKLEFLNLVGTKVTDAGLEHLKFLTNLKYLFLEFTNVTDSGMEHLKGLKNLEYLGLDNSKVTDAGLEHLEGLTNLKDLSIIGPNITDAGLEHLKGLTNLKELDLYGTKVTNEGIQKLRQALPNCKIYPPRDLLP